MIGKKLLTILASILALYGTVPAPEIPTDNKQQLVETELINFVEGKSFSKQFGDWESKVYTFQVNPEEYSIVPVQAEEYGDLLVGLEQVIANNPRASGIINGGFYEPNFEPSGFLVKNYEVLQEVTSYAGSGIFLLDSNDNPKIIYKEKLEKEENIKQAIQCGPLLVTKGKNALAGQSLKPSSYVEVPRTTISIDKENNVHFHVFSGINLADLSEYLSKDYEYSLNLDGGPSSNIFFRQEKGDTKYKIGPVQNYLVISKK